MRLLTLGWLALAVVATAGVTPSVAAPAGVLAFVRAAPGRADVNAGVDLWAIRSDGRGARRIVGGAGWDESPAWSPHGTRIAFDKAFYEAGEREDALTAIDVWIAGVGGRGRRNVTRDGSASSPAWSPDGETLAYARGDGIFVVRPNGAGKRHVARRDDPTAPAWSPDGRRIAFVSPGRLWVVGANRAGARLLARGASSDANAVWSPDGRSIAYRGSSGGAGAGVFVVSSAGGGPDCSPGVTRKRSGRPTVAGSRSSTPALLARQASSWPHPTAAAGDG